MKAATGTVTLSSRVSVPDQKYLNLRGVRHQAVKLARVAHVALGLSTTKVHAAFRHHVLRLQSDQWRQVCE